MCSNPLQNVIIILSITLLPVIVPYLYFQLTGIDKITTQLQASCIKINEDNKNMYIDQLCLSCYFKNLDHVPEQFDVYLQDIDTKSIMKYPNSRAKKIISSNNKYLQTSKRVEKYSQKNSNSEIVREIREYLKLQSILQCKDILHMLNYEKIIENKQLAINQLISELNFQPIQSITSIIKLLKLKMQDQENKSQFYISPQKGVYAVAQVVRRNILDLRGNLVQISHPSKKIVEQFQAILFGLCYLTCTSILSFLLFKLATTKRFYFQLLTNITIICGMLTSLHYHGLQSNNIFFLTSLILFACITFLKLQMKKVHVFLLGTCASILGLMGLASGREVAGGLMIAISAIVIVVIFFHSYRSFQNRPFFIYLWAVWNVLAFLTVLCELYGSFRALVCRNILIIVSVALMEVVNKEKIILFGEEPQNNFSKIQQIQEQTMEQQTTN